MSASIVNDSTPVFGFEVFVSFLFRPISVSSLIKLLAQILNTVRMYRSKRVFTAVTASSATDGNLIPIESKRAVHFNSPFVALWVVIGNERWDRHSMNCITEDAKICSLSQLCSCKFFV